MKKKALIFGITDKDGAYLSKFLLKKYIVHGVKRKSSSSNTNRIDDIYEDPHNVTNFYLHYGDLSDFSSIINLIEKIRPNEIYNLAAQSHVKVSFEIPEYTADINALGALRILEAIRIISKKINIKYYQAGTSEMFGKTKPPQDEKSKFYPEIHTQFLKFLLTGLQSIAERLIIFLLAMGFCLIMRVQLEDFRYKKNC